MNASRPFIRTSTASAPGLTSMKFLFLSSLNLPLPSFPFIAPFASTSMTSAVVPPSFDVRVIPLPSADGVTLRNSFSTSTVSA